MKWIFSFSLLFLVASALSSQEIVFNKEIKLKSGSSKRERTLPIYNEHKNEIALFFLNKDHVESIRLNEKYESNEVISSYASDIEDHSLLGSAYDSTAYYLFLTDKLQFELHALKCDFNLKRTSKRIFPFSLRGEMVIESLSHNGCFYILTNPKRSSTLKLYAFKSDVDYQVLTYDLSSYRLGNNASTKLSAICKNTFSQIIDVRNPNPLDLTVASFKTYYYGNKIFIALDNLLQETKLVGIDLDNYMLDVDYFEQPEMICEGSENMLSNSYLYMDHLYQIKVCNKELIIQITNINDGSIVKNYQFHKKDTIPIRNSAFFIKKNSSLREKEKEIELIRTEQLLRKMTGDEIGLSVQLQQGKLEVTIGGIKIRNNSSGGSSMSMSTSSMSIPGPGNSVSVHTHSHYNPTASAYSSYQVSKSIHFKALLDPSSFEHVEGSIGKNVYDKIADLEKEIKKELASETIFLAEDFYLVGYYVKSERKYYLRRFED